MKKLLLSAFLLANVVTPAFADVNNQTQQVTTVTAGNIATWAGNRTLQDGGTASSGLVTLTGTQTLTNKTLTDFINTDAKASTSQLDVTSSTVLVNVPGLSVNVNAAGTYAFHVHLATTANASGGVKVGLGGTSTWTSINTTGYGYTASAVAVTTGTTATPGTAVVTDTAAVIGVVLEGTVVVNAAGTITVQFAQNASNGAASSVFVNSYMELTRIS